MTDQDHLHTLVFALVESGPYSEPHLKCATAGHATCEFNEYVDSEGHNEALYALRWPPKRRGSIQFPLIAVERRDEEAPDDPTWEFEIVGGIR